MAASVDNGNSSSGAEFDVFLSFSGPDTRLTFADYLYHSLVKAGFRVFRDAEEIRAGEKIGDELRGAIASSKIYLPIFSKNYADSKWCLRELSQMVECHEKGNGTIAPIFYYVEPHDVKLVTSLYDLSLLNHAKKFDRNVVKEWDWALKTAAKLKGWHLRDQG